jgi:CBS domain containing-hemolysin-like protein
MLFDQLVVLIVLLLLSGFFSSAETALFSISRAKARHIAKEKGLTNALIKKMKDDPHRLLSTILIGNNLVNVGAAALATSMMIQLVASNAVGIATGVMTALILSIFFIPIIYLLNFIPRLTSRVQRKSRVTEEELMTFVEVVEEEGGIEEEEKELIHNIFEFDDTSASEIMTPRADMFVINVDDDLNVEEIIRSGFSRIPVIAEDIDHVIGILNIKDLFMHQVTSAQQTDVRRVMNEPYFVPENKKLDHLLQEFKKRKQHIAIVVDEHGGVSGLITLEDALEEIVGEIVDETDRVEPHIVKLKQNEWRVLGKSEIDDVNDELQMEIPDTKEYDTFSGYVLDQIGRIPREKEDIQLGDYVVTVHQMDGTRIKEYIVKKTEEISQEADQAS